MSSDSAQVLVVGCGLGGARVCQQLRNLGCSDDIAVLGSEPHLPYRRPELSKSVLAGVERQLRLPIDFEAIGVDLRLGLEATRLRLAEKVVETAGTKISYERLVIATGAVPVRLPGPGRQHVLRTLDDAESLRDELKDGRRVVIIGASWIGAEVATAALSHGCEVVCIEVGGVPLERVVGSEVGTRLLPWWDGVDLVVHESVASVEAGRVVLSSGRSIQADLVVTAVGVRPATGWLGDSGLTVDGWVTTDAYLRAAPGVVAVGDVASWWSHRYQQQMIVEHWENANAAASAAAASLMDENGAAPYDPIPYFWSDQFGHKLQYVGHHGPSDRRVLRRGAGSQWSIAWLSPPGRVSAWLAVDSPRELLAAEKLISNDVVVDDESLAEATVADLLQL